MKTRVVFFGTSTFGLPAFQAVLRQPDIDVVAVVTQPARPTGRKQEIVLGPVARWADEQQLLTLSPLSLKKPETQSVLAELSADIFLVASYGLILPRAILQLPTRGCLNIHASMLPKFRGASPIAAAIMNGETETGITYMLMDEGCDTGPMLRQHSIPITAQVDRPALEDQLSRLAGDTVVPLLHDWLAGTVVATPQPATGSSLAPKIKREDGRAVWSSATSLERRIRALTPWPGIWTTWRSREIKILSADVDLATSTEDQGRVRARGRGWAIACGDGWLVPKVIQFSGKRPQPAESVPGSYPRFLDDRLD